MRGRLISQTASRVGRALEQRWLKKVYLSPSGFQRLVSELLSLPLHLYDVLEEGVQHIRILGKTVEVLQAPLNDYPHAVFTSELSDKAIRQNFLALFRGLSMLCPGKVMFLRPRRLALLWLIICQ